MAMNVVFLNYLQQLKPLLVDGFANDTVFSNRTVQKVANRPDFLLPFRQKAPTIKKALETIYSDTDRLLKPEGLWNILVFRGVTYGSLYAAEDLRWFDSYLEWNKYYQASKKDRTKEYFVNTRAYGTVNRARHIENILLYWNERHRWSGFIPKGLNVQDMFEFLIQKRGEGKARKTVFHNIGNLAALLVCGDLVELGILQMPTIEEWACIIYKVGKGAVYGLQCLALLGPTFTKEECIFAFKTLHTFLLEKISSEDRELMGYNIIMLEHSLCKFTRTLSKTEKPPKPSKPEKPTNQASGKKRQKII
jgi:hypothetical protein